MTPTPFEQSNVILKSPSDMDQSQVRSIPGFLGNVQGGPMDGAKIIVVAWKPDAVDLAALNAGGTIYLVCVGGLPPHTLATEFPRDISII